jgi:hypothetical protein
MQARYNATIIYRTAFPYTSTLHTAYNIFALQAGRPTHTRTKMADYDSDNDSHACDPVLHGVTGDACGTCSATTVPLYDLSCHDSDDFYCRDCLTKAWYLAKDDVIRCPSCGEDCDFMPLQPIEQFKGISRNFVDHEAFDKIRQQPEIMNNLIAFTASEAIVFLNHVYTFYADQLLDPVELGALPTCMAQQSGNTLGDDLSKSPFYCAFAAEVSVAPKSMNAPAQLEELLLNVLNSVTTNFTKFKYDAQMYACGVDLSDDADVPWQATQSFQDVNNIKEHWIGIIKMWVDLLAWRPIERTAPGEGGAAERFRQPLPLKL